MTGSHDVERLMTVMLRITKDDRRLARDLVKAFSLIQFTIPGVPLIYYGDETCLEGERDPDNRRTYPWNAQDPGNDRMVRRAFPPAKGLQNAGKRRCRVFF